MEFKSTLERADEKATKRGKELLENGDVSDILNKTFKLVTHSKDIERCLQTRAVEIARTTQPSITRSDLTIAVNMMCAMATQLVHNLLKEGLINIKE